MEHPVNRLQKLAFMLVVACIQKKIINYLSWWLITGSEWLDNYIMSFNRVPAHGFIMGKSPDFPYLCVYKSICQRLALEKKKVDFCALVCYILIVSYLFVKAVFCE